MDVMDVAFPYKEAITNAYGLIGHITTHVASQPSPISKGGKAGVKDMDFSGVLEKEPVEIPGVLVFDLGVTKGWVRKCNSAGISKECLTILHYFQG